METVRFPPGGSCSEIGPATGPAVQLEKSKAIIPREFRPVGGCEVIFTDLRIISATNRDLSSIMERGALCGDLQYRLNVIGMGMPPPRRRRGGSGKYDSLPERIRNHSGTVLETVWLTAPGTGRSGCAGVPGR